MKKELYEKLYSEREAADYFGWSVFTMREIRKRGEIQYLIFQDKTIRYTLKQLEAYKNRHLKQVAVQYSE
jgi:predicted site-specific integrase-resolvase